MVTRRFVIHSPYLAESNKIGVYGHMGQTLVRTLATQDTQAKST